MTAEIQHQRLNAFTDGELDLHEQIELEADLRKDPTLRAQAEDLMHLRRAVRRGAEYHAAPAALRARIAALVAMPPVASPASQSKRPSRSVLARWFAWRPMVPALIVAAGLATGLHLFQRNGLQEERLSEAVLATHVRATLAERVVDVASSDHHTVKPWLSSKLDFSPPVRELNLPGSVFLGGRVDYLDGHPVAALVYRQGQHLVDAFIWPSSDGDRRVTFSVQRGFHLAHWARNGMEYWAISDLNREEFAAVIDELAQ